MLRPDHRYQARLGRSAVEAGRPGVAGKLVIGDQHEINAADAGGQVEPPGPVEDLGGTQAPRYMPPVRCRAIPSSCVAATDRGLTWTPAPCAVPEVCLACELQR